MSVPSAKAELVFKNDATLGECPVWDEKNNLLYWVDILSGELYRYNPVEEEHTVFPINEHIGSFALCGDMQGAILAVRSGFAFLEWKNKKITRLSDPESHVPGNRFNDGKCDPYGRFWAGTLSYDGYEGTGSIYCVNSEYNVSKKMGGFTIPNGMAWDTEEHLFYLIDSSKQTIYCFDYDQETGKLGNQSVVVKLDNVQGLPDGMTIDEENKLWVAIYNGAKVIRIDPATGRILYSIKLPVPQVTSCTFGGPGLNELYITTAREHMAKEQIEQVPLSGSLFKAKLPFEGKVACCFTDQDCLSEKIE